ncbi:endo-1,4-beta-xylanase [Bacteroidales bacterium]|nr:endo-1,4-beta-xylanase [Bacteroidales bacterium]
MKLLIYVYLFFVPLFAVAQNAHNTYCNPINLDYGFTPIPNFSQWGKHRATADPVIVNYKNEYYLFSTNQWGYWCSKDLLKWDFIPRLFLKPHHKVYDELCAPAVWIQGDTLLVMGSTYSKDFPIWMSTNPKANEWKEAVMEFELGGWDPQFFVDTDERLYMYNGSSNSYPMYGVELNRSTFQPIGTRKEILLPAPHKYGWHRFGEHHDDTFLDGFMEGAFVTKHNNKYYLQWGGPGTEFSGYADGVAISEHPLGPFQHVALPMSYKPGGFARGAGHGATFQDKYNNYWHVSTMVVNVKNSFERRLGLWPAGFDKDDVMYCNTAFGDYPHYLPTDTNRDHNRFTGWMLLNYNKPVQVSSTLGGFNANNAVDESIKTYWSAQSSNKGEWILSDLGEISTIHGIQINYADQDAQSLGKRTDIYHQYKVYASLDGKKWNTIIDKSTNKTDVPHEYVELDKHQGKPLKARYIKLENIHTAEGKFAIAGLRVFGFGNGEKPLPVKEFMVLRTEKDKRSAWVKWSPSSDAYAYNIYVGTDPEKLYNCIMVHNANEYYYKAMDKDIPYYFCIEAINENGTSTRTQVVTIN